MKISILTLFPEMFNIFDFSIIGRAREKGIVDLNCINIRDYTLDKHKKVDAYPYGGGGRNGYDSSANSRFYKSPKKRIRERLYFRTKGKKLFNQSLARELSKEEELKSFSCDIMKELMKEPLSILIWKYL